MEGISFSKTVYQHFACHRSLFSPSSSSIYPRSLRVKASSSPKTLALICAGHLTYHSPPKEQELLFSLVKPAVLSLTAAAAVFLTRYSLPSLASVSTPTSSHPAPAAESESLSEDHESREKILEEHVLSYPKDVKSLQTLVHLKVKNQKLGEAIAIVDQLIRLEPDDGELHLLKSHLHIYNGDTEKAREGFEEILSENPFLVDAYHGLVIAAAHARDTKVLDIIVDRVEGVMKRCEKEKKRSELRDFKLLLAQIRMIEGKYQEALKVYEEMVKEEPRDFRPYLCQGIVYVLMKKMDEADKNFRQYRRLVPKNHPYAQLFENSLSGLSASLRMNSASGKVGSVQT